MTDLHKLLHGEGLAREKFAAPSREFGILPFWFWNGEMDYGELEYQLRELKDKGLPGICVHARFGINEHIPYLGDDWFDRIRFTVRKAQEIGLQIWVYDEYNWPSGTAGKSIMKDRPELTNRYLELVEDNIPGQYFTFMEGTDSRYHDLEHSNPIYACAILEEDLAAGRPNFVDLMPSLSFNKVISWEAPPGPWKLFYFIERKAGWYTDVLDDEAVDEFLRRTHERYKQQLGPESLAGQICGIYTDEPAMHYFEIFKKNYTIPWSRHMFRIFSEHNGYNLRPLLPHLFYQIGPESEQIRFDFFSALSARYEKTYYAKIGDWCKQNQVVFTGHLLCEESVRLHAKTGGNLFHMLRHFDLTGVDHLYPRVGTREMPEEHIALKIASSAAHQNGSTRLICESMGGLYWDCTLERMKWVADWEYVLGVNILNPHGFHYSIEGSRKRDWPPSQFYHHSWWKQYAGFNTYLSRLGYALTGGHHVAKLAVLYPINSVWATFTPQTETPVGALIREEFAWLCDRLLRQHTDYDILDEDVMAECTLADGSLCIRGERYEALVLPAVTHLKAPTFDLLEQFVAGGGKLLASALLPMAAVTPGAGDVAARMQRLFGTNGAAVRARYEAGQANGSTTLHEATHGRGLALFAEGPGFARGDDTALLAQAVRRMITPEVEIESDEIFCLHRVKDGQDFFFLVNPTDRPIHTRVRLAGKHTPEQWDLQGGGITPLPVYEAGEDYTAFALDFEPVGSALIGARPYSGAPHLLAADFTVTEVGEGRATGYTKGAALHATFPGGVSAAEAAPAAVSISLPARWAFETDRPNCILTDRWKAAYATEEDAAAFAGALCGEAYDFSGWMDFRMGAWEMQLAEERLDDAYPVSLWYVTEFMAEYLPPDAALLIDGFAGSGYDLYVNGHPVAKECPRSFLDAEIGAAPIGPLLQKGRNVVAVRLTVTKASDGMLDLLKLVGSFAVCQQNGRDVITAPVAEMDTGDWCGMGLPYFSGTGSYSGTLHVPPELCDGHRLLLEVDVGSDVVEAEVNGRPAGQCLWRPYRLDLTDCLQPGENRLCLRVVNTMVNILEGKAQASGLFAARLTAYPLVTLHAQAPRP